jgi:hypothetical protein
MTRQRSNSLSTIPCQPCERKHQKAAPALNSPDAPSPSHSRSEITSGGQHGNAAKQIEEPGRLRRAGPLARRPPPRRLAASACSTGPAFALTPCAMPVAATNVPGTLACWRLSISAESSCTFAELGSVPMWICMVSKVRSGLDVLAVARSSRARGNAPPHLTLK